MFGRVQRGPGKTMAGQEQQQGWAGLPDSVCGLIVLRLGIRSFGAALFGHACKQWRKAYLDRVPWPAQLGPPELFVGDALASVELINWALSAGCSLEEWRLTPDPVTLAAGGGHLDALEWLRARGCPWDSTTVTLAMYNGHTEVMLWAHSHGCPHGM